MTKTTAPRVRAEKLYAVELDGKPVAQAMAISKAGNLFWAGNPQDWRGVDCSLYATHVPAQAVPESVDGLVSVFCYDEVLTFTFCDEAAADRFAGRFDPSVDSAEAPEHKA